ncbi:Acetyltransferase (GNAT) family protein [Devosia enhydra]|uniref:Acetyltransferase (GNAT) family protein n=1 Tax=Devosia enhydra TaxID=665118 RepID=A0A1K2I0D2_9HYPH|nr:GNAT family N-acetyltransferase [Devosia enhydra]SFZ85785.1 Acetyltransferase (GNAT) family protein [Devosia enhydra]
MGPDAIAAIDAAGLVLWPALETIDAGIWHCRFAEGFTRRANSICVGDAASADTPLHGLAEAAALYGERGIAPAFRATPLTPPGVIALLSASGWIEAETVAVMAMSLVAPLGALPADITRHDPRDKNFQAAQAKLCGYTARQAHTLSRMLARLPGPAAGLLIRIDGEPLGTALVALDRDIAYVFSVAVAPEARGRGLGRALMQGALAFAADTGATTCALQVVPENHVARGLYLGLGFADLYSYTYWTAP